MNQTMAIEYYVLVITDFTWKHTYKDTFCGIKWTVQTKCINEQSQEQCMVSVGDYNTDLVLLH